MADTLIRVIDLETTGFAPPAEVIEIGWVDLTSIDRVHWISDQPQSTLVRPNNPVPPETSAIHHLIDEDLVVAPLMVDALDMAKKLPASPGIRFILAAHSAKFEQQWLQQPFGAAPWICTWKCALRLWPEAPGFSNQCLRYWLKPEGLDRQFANQAHRAAPDAYVTSFTLRAMLARASVDELILWSSQPALLPRVPFGQSKGMRWTEVDLGFLHWVLARDFDEDVMHTARTEMQRRRELAGMAPGGDEDDGEE